MLDDGWGFVNERWIFAVYRPARFYSYVMWLLHKCLVGGNKVQRGKKSKLSDKLYDE